VVHGAEEGHRHTGRAHPLRRLPGNNAWAGALHFESRPIGPVLRLIAAHVQVMLQLVAEFPTAWDSTGTIVDPQRQVEQKVSVADMIGFLGGHVEMHLKTIEAIKQQHKPDAAPVNPPLAPRRLTGANMDIDLATPEGEIAWSQMKCPWNEAEQTNKHRCAVKNTSICHYFCGVQPLDTLLCSYPQCSN
jgi:hypothetical protein